tara:strand:- start:108 stop:545 length:438 start_codon:yes stop_codon:yes gene_type:complete
MSSISKAPADLTHVDEPSLADFLPDTSSGYTVYAGTALADSGGNPLGEEAVISALKTIKDPEIPVNIYDLGLIYDITCFQNGNVAINMSLTAPGCPVAGEMPAQVAEAVAALTGAGQISVTLVWEPAWTPERMSEDAKLALDYGI